MNSNFLKINGLTVDMSTVESYGITIDKHHSECDENSQGKCIKFYHKNRLANTFDWVEFKTVEEADALKAWLDQYMGARMITVQPGTSPTVLVDGKIELTGRK